ncbi:MAG: hypothetical protein JO165_06465 [Candidatus Eremiobacteraeota bacterium]|nr:hypothetical protein [Candidatus Eremiobacteraeota bacterium]
MIGTASALTATGAAVPAPLTDFKKLQIDARTGFALLEQPIFLEAPSPVLADGTTLTASPDVSYGALLYRVDKFGKVQIYDGSSFTDESSFNFLSSAVKPAELSFDKTTRTWKGVFVLSIVPTTDSSFTVTDPTTHRPAYGFLAVLRAPRKPTPLSASASPLGESFGVIATADTMRVKLGMLDGLDSAQDPKNADGFAIYAKDGSLVPVAQLIVSSNASVPAGISLEVFQGGSLRAALTVDANGAVTVNASTQATLQAPIVRVEGELRAGNIFYHPFDGSPGRYL